MQPGQPSDVIIGGPSAFRIAFTDQRPTAHGGLIVWSHLLQQLGFRKVLENHLPHQPTSPNAYRPSDIALGRLHCWAVGRVSSRKEGCTLDLDSWSLLHEDGHQDGVAAGYTPRGLEPCQRPPVAAQAEARMIAGCWLRSGNNNCVNGAAEFLRQTLSSLSSHLRVGLVRADSGFSHESVLSALEERGLHYVMATRLTQPVQSLCRHEDACWVDIENRIEDLGDQFGVKQLDCGGFWATETVHHLAIAAYNLRALLQRRLGQMEHCPPHAIRSLQGQGEVPGRQSPDFSAAGGARVPISRYGTPTAPPAIGVGIRPPKTSNPKLSQTSSLPFPLRSPPLARDSLVGLKPSGEILPQNRLLP